ncbi:MAG: hypothetical protein ABJO86_14615 [Lentilitoribacter sp.]
MSLSIKIMTFGFITLLVLVAIIYIFVGFERIWTSMAGAPSSEIVEIANVQKTRKPNQYLVCPEAFCEEKIDRASPVFNAPVDKIRQILASIAGGDANFTKVNADTAGMREKYIMRSPFWKFPNLISVEYIPLENDQSTLAIYAQAQLGQSDLNANKAFIDQLLSEISSQI